MKVIIRRNEYNDTACQKSTGTPTVCRDAIRPDACLYILIKGGIIFGKEFKKY